MKKHGEFNVKPRRNQKVNSWYRRGKTNNKTQQPKRSEG